jgi:sodium pump decarboxylase gamma subunit
MIVAGLKLTLLGMMVVFLFLVALILLIKLSFRMLSAGSARELAAMESAELKKRKRSFVETDEKLLIAIISAAIATHRSRIRIVG